MCQRCALGIVAALMVLPASADEKESDRSGHRLLPVPIFITEPALGEGLGLALTVFHPNSPANGDVSNSSTSAQQSYRQNPPPIVSAIFAAKTNNGTYAVGVGHTNHWREDSIRFLGYLATANVVSKFYVVDQPLDFELDGNLIHQELKFRFGRSRWFLGPGISWLNADNKFSANSTQDPTSQAPDSLQEATIRNAGIAAKGLLDSLDNSTMPTTGRRVRMGLWRFDQNFGGDFDYWRAELNALSFHRLGPRFVLGLRLDVMAVDGTPPFFDFPSVKLRGIPALRYQADVAGAVEVEGRFEMHRRWLATVFAGRGFTASDEPFTADTQDIWSVGAGARYQLFEEQNVWFGIDVARGPEQWAFYIKINHGW